MSKQEFHGHIPHENGMVSEILDELYNSLDSEGIDLRIAEARERVTSLLEAAGLDEDLGDIRAGESIASVIDHWRSEDNTD
ncbi:MULTISPECIES: hypothetical protein [Haloferax]|uniref:Uncharacterized protein n=2 Tax=Haloferax TaxID=2251 RepID=A0A6G1Z646_9EURY|nr:MULTISPECIES: hypothetical protein [Haloferax]KAB1185383.1 hypothetical protein Hfx1149_15115 [Haloferax sp. CBA1149]MRW82026.1 hypothetical protein [Haloferax marinisediminis]